MNTSAPRSRKITGLIIAAWLWVGVPFLYGVYELSVQVTQLFRG